jgi:glucose/arabinose dehydrogenase
LSFPTSLAFDDTAVAYVAEAGLPFDGSPPGGRIWRIEPGGSRELFACGLRPPVNGITFHQGSLYVSEGGCISRIDLDRQRTVILDNLPGPGNYHTNMVVFGPEDKLYFSQGAMTNTGIVGLDAYELGWLRRLPHAHDLPGYKVVLSGVNAQTPNPLAQGRGDWTRTGAFVPFGTLTEQGQALEGRLPCTAGIMRCNADGSNLELVAWGLRNAYGLGFLPDGRLLATDQGADDRGSRPVGNAPDLLFDVRAGMWYGWPDFIGGDPISDAQYRPSRGPAPKFLLANHAELPRPERPLVRFPAHAAAVKFDIVPGDVPEFGGQIIVALFGDERPMTAPPGPRVGRSVARIDPVDWSLYPFLAGPLSRPIDVRFSPVDRALYVVDFGEFEMCPEQGMIARAGSGRLWRFQYAM